MSEPSNLAGDTLNGPVNGARSGKGGTGFRPGSCATTSRSIHPGNVGELSGHAVELAGRRRLAGLEIDRVEHPAGCEPRGVVLALVDDVERNPTVELDAERTDRIQHTVIRRRLRYERAGRHVDVVKRGRARLRIGRIRVRACAP